MSLDEPPKRSGRRYSLDEMISMTPVFEPTIQSTVDEINIVYLIPKIPKDMVSRHTVTFQVREEFVHEVIKVRVATIVTRHGGSIKTWPSIRSPEVMNRNLESAVMSLHCAIVCQ